MRQENRRKEMKAGNLNIQGEIALDRKKFSAPKLGDLLATQEKFHVPCPLLSRESELCVVGKFFGSDTA
jgi:hypothetical protein